MWEHLQKHDVEQCPRWKCVSRAHIAHSSSGYTSSAFTGILISSNVLITRVVGVLTRGGRSFSCGEELPPRSMTLKVGG